jgi:hypothetical protein
MDNFLNGIIGFVISGFEWDFASISLLPWSACSDLAVSVP